MTEIDLSKALNECSEAAKSGYELASAERDVLDGILHSAEEKIRETTIDYMASPCKVIGTGESLESQLSEIRGAINNLRMSFAQDIEVLGKNLEKFSVTLFGRTMAGKSTLMEVLTEGDGTAIGKGAQRTTRDIRRYVWNGLAVTDVPGIGAFEGEEDSRLAFDAARTADLIVFLLTDDAPQAVEAECFSQIKDLGKPVIVIMNVKVSIESGKSLKLIERDMKRAFDYDRIEEIRQQFCKFAETYGQDWSAIPFVATHLKAAYEAVRCEMSEDEEIRSQAEFWRENSRIDVLKSILCEEVRVRGRYIRVKTFADIIVNPMIETLYGIDSQSGKNAYQGRIIAEKRKAFTKWKETFIKTGKKQIESFMMRLKTEFRMEIAAFAEVHYNDKLADVAWNKLVEGKDLEGRCREFLDEMEADVDSYIRETLREMASELNYVSLDTKGRSFLTPEFVDAGRIVNWTSLILGSGGLVAATILSLVGIEAAAGPVGWIAAGLTTVGGIGCFIFESRGDNLARARAKLEKELIKSVNEYTDSIWLQLEKNMDKLVKGKIDLVLSELAKIEDVIEALSSTQTSLADSLRLELRSLNTAFTGNIASSVFHEESAQEYVSKIESAARIPGVCTLLSEKTKGALDHEFCTKMSDLISEEMRVVTENEDTASFVYDVLDGMVSPENITVDEETKAVTLKVSKPDAKLSNRLRLLEQFLQYKMEESIC